RGLILAMMLCLAGCGAEFVSTDYGVLYHVRGCLVDDASGMPLAGRRLCLSHWEIPSPYITPDNLTWYVTAKDGEFWAECGAITGRNAVADALTLGVQRPDHSWQYQPIPLSEQQKKDVCKGNSIDLGTIDVNLP